MAFYGTGVIHCWVCFNGEAGIRDSHQVSSVSENAQGDYTVNFSSACANTDFSWTASVEHNSVSTEAAPIGITGSRTSSAVRYRTRNVNGSNVDRPYNHCHVFGDP